MTDTLSSTDVEEPYRKLPLDRRVSDIGLLRFAAAVISVIGCVWLALSGPPAWAWVLVVGGLFFAWFWLRRWAQAAKQTLEPDQSYLDLTEDGFSVATAGEVQDVAWERVRVVEADEERVAIRIELAETDAPLYVEATYGGLGLYELEAAMQTAREASPSRGG